MLIGYARISTADQNDHLQQDALKKAGCTKIFSDTVSGSIKERPALSKAMAMLREGDTLVLWRLDRWGRSLQDLITNANELEKMGVGFMSLTESINTGTPAGKMVFHIFGALAEFERNLIIERTNAGLAAARARGKFGGRPRTVNINKMKHAIKLYHEGETSIKEICELASITKPTLYKYIKDAEVKKAEQKL